MCSNSIRMLFHCSLKANTTKSKIQNDLISYFLIKIPYNRLSYKVYINESAERSEPEDDPQIPPSLLILRPQSKRQGEYSR